MSITAFYACKEAYLMMKELENLGFNTWVTNVRNILAECNSSHIYARSVSIEKRKLTVLRRLRNICMLSFKRTVCSVYKATLF